MTPERAREFLFSADCPTQVDAIMAACKAENDALRALLKAWSHFTDETIDAELKKGRK